jgi:hypothetical protein
MALMADYLQSVCSVTYGALFANCFVMADVADMAD